MRFYFPKLLRREQAYSGNTVSQSAATQFLNRRSLLFADCYDYFSADLVGYVVRTTKPNQLCGAFNAELRLERTRTIVDAGVDHSAVVAGLMEPYRAFLFQNHDSQLWESRHQLHGSGKAHDAGADDGDIICCAQDVVSVGLLFLHGAFLPDSQELKRTCGCKLFRISRLYCPQRHCDYCNIIADSRSRAQLCTLLGGGLPRLGCYRRRGSVRTSSSGMTRTG